MGWGGVVSRFEHSRGGIVDPKCWLFALSVRSTKAATTYATEYGRSTTRQSFYDREIMDEGWRLNTISNGIASKRGHINEGRTKAKRAKQRGGEERMEAKAEREREGEHREIRR